MQLVDLQNHLSRYEIFKPLTRRELEIKFTNRLNADRGDLKPLSVSFVSWKMKVARLNTKNDLVAFYQMCDSSNNFGKTWWGSMKV